MGILQDSDLDFNSVAKCLGLTAPSANGHAMRYDEFGSANAGQMTSTGVPQHAAIGLGRARTSTYLLDAYSGSGTTFLNVETGNAGSNASLRMANTGRAWVMGVRGDLPNNPYAFADQTAGAIRFYLDSVGNIAFQTTTIPTSAALAILMGGATATTFGSSTSDVVQLGHSDSAANFRNLYAKNEEGQVNRLTGLRARAASDFSKTSDTTLASVTGLSRPVAAGEIYAFRAVLQTTSNSAGGVKFAIGGTATATSLFAEATVKDGSALATMGTPRVTAMTTTFGDVTAVSNALVIIEGQITVNAGGTLTIQFAQNASNGTASTVKAGSYMELISIGS